MTINDLGRWESMERVQRYTRSVTSHDSQPTREWINIVHAGSIVAFIGALVVMVSGFIRSR